MTTSKSNYKLNKYYTNRVEVIPINILPRKYNITSNTGLDERFDINEQNKEQLFNVSLNNDKKKILGVLMDKNVPYITKMELIINSKHLFDYDILKSSISKGGLFDDYNFDDFGFF
tara:strand:+ start:559 stop:906 length:348 start_codon:yes stop_codon:yes gene_type:complete